MTKIIPFTWFRNYCLPVVLLLVCFSYNTREEDPQLLYAKANKLFQLPNPTDRTDSTALVIFNQVITLLQQRGAVHDTILFYSLLKKGILLDVKNNFPAAKNAYLQARTVKSQNAAWSDSLLYEVSVYTGSIYYRMNHFDSANYYLLQAEELSQRYPKVPQQERLYNELGALYFENGNFLQSKNYFSHALALVNAHQKPDDGTVANIENNIALSYYKLGQYSQALAIYRKRQSQADFGNQVLLNMGVAYRALRNYTEALACFRRVNTSHAPGAWNELAHVHWLQKRNDSSAYFLHQFEQWAAKKESSPTGYDEGVNKLYSADLLIDQQQYEAAIGALQEAIISFSGRFTNKDIYSNPTSFTGTFTSFSLYDALYKKAGAFEKLYQSQNKERFLQAARATYNSAISLLRYIEKSYDTDDAKLFLKNNSQLVYQHAFLICMELHKLHPTAGYLEQAFIIGEKSKASIMYAGVQEKGFQKMPGIDEALIHKERNIKYNLARLSVKSDQAPDSAAQEAIAKEKAAIEIELSRVQKQIEQNSVYYKQKYSESSPGIKDLSKELEKDQALFSFFSTANQLHLFVITQDDFKYSLIGSFDSLQKPITQWVAALRNIESGRKFEGGTNGAVLYQRLVKPMQSLAANKEQWTIIPDNILYFLPFESLPADDKGTTLLETNEISYQFSSRFVVNNTNHQPLADYTVLAFAPFAQKGLAFPHRTYKYMDRLGASAEEIADLTGKKYLNSQATKHQFLLDVNKYAVVHLATHAIADSSNPAASFIAFYPNAATPGEDALYLEELYSLNLDATKLIIISACETGHGQLVNSEGVLSLTRGFAYAGCPGIVNSLWKADDAATSAILQRFHSYLQKGYTKSKALRQAKLDYLHSNAIYKSPGYWAHLLVIGDVSPVVSTSTSYWRWIIMFAGLVIAGWILKAGIRRRKKVDVVS